MQTTFLSQLAEQITALHLPMEKSVVVLPNRRARRMLFQALAARAEGPIFAPAVFTINDFIDKLSPLESLDKFALLVHLYHTYKELAGDDADDFSTALSWMPAFVDDMSEVDKQLDSAERILSDLASAKRFEIGFGQDEVSEEQAHKVAFFNMLAQLYVAFKERLAQQGCAYDGMLYRDCAEHAEQYVGQLPYEHYIFAGFHVLNPAELAVVKAIQDRFDTYFFFDIDPFYCDFQKEERFTTAHFLSKICQKLNLDEKRVQFRSDSYATVPKEVRIVGTSKDMNQIYYAIQCLEEIKERQGNLDDTALVLADESLLVPLLAAYDTRDANVTMGYPLTATPAYSLLTTLLEIYERGQSYGVAGTAMRFHRRDVIAILQSPIIQGLCFETPKQYHETLEKIRSEQHFFYEMGELADVPVPAFGEVSGLVPALLEYMRGLLARIVSQTDVAMLQPLIEQLEQVQGQLQLLVEAGVPLTLSIVKYAIRQQMGGVSLSLKGDATHGLQIMGLLETRTLDFKNVIMLSVNEGKLPTGISYNSIIPFDFKFQGETLENYLYKDQVYAYHFFRLLQRAEQVVLIYDNDTTSGNLAEKSRFVAQLEFEVRERGLDNIHITYPTVAFPYIAATSEGVEVRKNDEILKKIYEYSFSATALKTYISCPLQFYLKHICGIRTSEKVTDHVEANAVGSVVHAVFEKVFDVTDGPKSDFSQRIDDYLAHLDDNLRQLVLTDEELRKSVRWEEKDLSEGRVYLAMAMIRNDVKNYLEKSKTEFRERGVAIVGNELKLSCKLPVDGHPLTLYGVVDRLETEVDPATGNRHLSVVDYKTGNVNSDNLSVDNDGIGNIFTDPAYKEFLQLLFYALLCKYADNETVKQYVDDNPIRCSILSIMDVNMGKKDYLHRAQFEEKIEKRKVVTPDFTKDALSTLEDGLKGLLGKIINKDLPFTQTDDPKRCIYCDFKHLCGRT